MAGDSSADEPIPMKSVLITGSAGRIGQAAVHALVSAGWRVLGFDRVPSPGVHEDHQGTLTDADALRKAATGVHAMIHLAATPDDADFLSELLPNNLVGLHSALEAARSADVKRLLLASTGQVNWWQQHDGPLPVHPGSPYTPKHWYAVTKITAEFAGRIYAHHYGLQVLVVRLGWCPRTDAQIREIAASPLGQNTYLSPGDAGRFFVAALAANVATRFATVFATSLPVDKTVMDLEPTAALIGWRPQDRWPQGVRIPA